MSSNPLLDENSAKPQTTDAAAVELIRSKVAKAYGDEPIATEELEEAQRERVLSKHQQFIMGLSQENKSLAEIQTEWHRYYTQLPDDEKRQVWDEFYAANQHTPYQKLFQKQQPVASRARIEQPEPPAAQTAQSSRVVQGEGGITVSDHSPELPAKPSRKKPQRQNRTGEFVRKTKLGKQLADSEAAATTAKLKQRIQNKVSAGGKLQAKHHLQSLIFGLGMGGLVLLILLFSFFNEFVIAPFIQPSRTVTNAPIIVSDMTSTQAATPSVIVPSINVQIPVDFAIQTTSEAAIEDSLNNGVVHYSSTAYPGQNGNTALFGHSSQNIFNNGKYKFAFVALHLVKTGDIFYLTYNGKIYAYQIFAKEIVPPTQVSVLHDTKGKQATAVLITCDPPGFSTNRLVVWGEQISPNPAGNTSATQTETPQPQITEITSNGPTLWTRLWRSIDFWN
ncbi:sortase [Candidatus Saccharibacteria bacterium]|nr:sortase [Candidatus Saccharibacteria bacterium]